MIGAWLHTGTLAQAEKALKVLGNKLDFLVLQPRWHGHDLPIKLWYRCDTITQVRALPPNATCIFRDEVNVKPDGYDQKPIPAADYAKLLLDARRARPDITFVQAPAHPIGNWWQRLLWDMRHDDQWSDAVAARLKDAGMPPETRLRGWNPNKTKQHELARVLQRYPSVMSGPMLLSPAPFNKGWWERTVQPIKPPTWIDLARTGGVHVAFWQLIEDKEHGLVTAGGELTWMGKQL